ncbi:hypothetical protein HPB49_014064 [Dermacentor silvarum]|uniref:Uncharacterized protein n=1 Tax=Dermacentor silvarum TaxID=543639 RepID=A0ACB8D5X7_DERSI|nr:hypothetical protein HPB49_014064 [Dermacentor silvarum]
MDHRYRLLLTPDQKYRARMHLCKTWKRITGLQQNQCSSCIPESTAAPTSKEPEYALEAFLKTKEAEAGAQSHLKGEPGSTDIALLLEMLDKEPRLPRSTNVLKFWDERKERQPELYMLAQVALGVPATPTLFLMTHDSEVFRKYYRMTSETFEAGNKAFKAVGFTEARALTMSPCHHTEGTYSIVLMAVVDSQLRFVCVDVGAYGSQSDGGVSKASKLGKLLSQSALTLPPPQLLPLSTAVAPYVFIGDEAFQLRPDFLRSYPGRCLEEDLLLFNYRLSRVRQRVT